MSEHEPEVDTGLARQVLTDPVHLLAFGFGTGLSPVAPGTVGSVLGLLAAWLTLPFDMPVRIAVGVLMVLGGIWLCDASARRIGAHDHPGIVWDEIAALYLLVIFLPTSITLWALAFGLFRLFDIAKPWPISDLDHRLKGGLGIMLDDLVAVLYAALVLGLGRWLFDILS